MKNQNEAVKYLWQIRWFKEFRKPKEIKEKIEKDFEIYVENIIPTLKLRKFNKKIKNFPKKGWKQIRAPSEKGVKKDSNLEEIKECLGDVFKKEMDELALVSNNCPNSTAFLMRKILEKLLYITISKSDKKNRITKLREEQNRLPTLSELINLAKSAEIDDKHIIAPKNITKIDGSKFLGDTSAHDYLTSVSFEDIKNEISFWRISIKQLCSNLNQQS